MDRIQIRILFGLKKSPKYEYEYQYSASTIQIIFEYGIIRSPLNIVIQYYNSITSEYSALLARRSRAQFQRNASLRQDSGKLQAFAAGLVTGECDHSGHCGQGLQATPWHQLVTPHNAFPSLLVGELFFSTKDDLRCNQKRSTAARWEYLTFSSHHNKHLVWVRNSK